MLLKGKNAVIYGAGGAIGGAVARAFAHEGARVFLAGRTLAKLDAVAKDISAAGGVVETAQVDALDERAVDEHANAVAEKTGGIDILFNAIGMEDVQGGGFSTEQDMEESSCNRLLRRLRSQKRGFGPDASLAPWSYCSCSSTAP